MIKEQRFLWKQMDGPQGNGIVTAIFNYFKEKFNTTLNYFDTLSIATANEQHLMFIGALMGIRRPFVANAMYYDKLFKFTNTMLENEPSGFATIYTSAEGVGGFLDVDLSSYEDNDNYELLRLADYRYVLLKVAELSGQTHSMVLLDAIVSAFIPSNINYIFSYSNNNIIVTFDGLAAYQMYLLRIVLNLFFFTSPYVELVVNV